MFMVFLKKVVSGNCFSIKSRLAIKNILRFARVIATLRSSLYVSFNIEKEVLSPGASTVSKIIISASHP